MAESAVKLNGNVQKKKKNSQVKPNSTLRKQNLNRKFGARVARRN